MLIINIILILTLAGKSINECVNVDETLQSTTPSFETTSDYFEEKPENVFFESKNTDFVPPPLKKSTAQNFFKEVRICRRKYQSLSSKTFKMNLYCFLLDPETRKTNENLKNDFYCNITKELTDQLKGKLNLMQFFQEILDLDQSKNVCSHDTVDGKYPKESISNKNIIGVEIEDNLKLKLGDEWIQMRPKVPYMSHIYLGTSKYPILTEESRIIDQRSSLLIRTSTQRIHIKKSSANDNYDSMPSQSSTVSKIYKLLKPYRWEKNYSRIPRSVKNTLGEDNTDNNYSKIPVIGMFFKSASANPEPVPDGIYYSGSTAGASPCRHFIEKGLKFLSDQFLRIFGYSQSI